MVMLIVCANLSNLQLARTATRQKEIAIRVALGAGRATPDSADADGKHRTVVLRRDVGSDSRGGRYAPPGSSGCRQPSAAREHSLSTRARSFFTFLIAVLTGLIFGLVPAIQVPAQAIHDSLKDGNRGSMKGRATTGFVRRWLSPRSPLLACFWYGRGSADSKLPAGTRRNLGFRPERAASLRIDPGSQYSTREKRNAYFDEVLRLAKSVPGIEAAGLTDVLPQAIIAVGARRKGSGVFAEIIRLRIPSFASSATAISNRWVSLCAPDAI